MVTVVGVVTTAPRLSRTETWTGGLIGIPAKVADGCTVKASADAIRGVDVIDPVGFATADGAVESVS